ncbi:Oxysterol-binding protein-like protein [Lachnellula occidentalis]|uniref:Oxysterol-binding protein-like protein n=1 Tax=Lachnellula occidentalis TaxID=215460 RepID=A0A8H8S7G7_9HELO|nr:Oxysterol-binding protein-like protein [Lachnellula occidentalis]
MAHPEMLLPIPELDDPVQRFVSVVKFYLSGWHIKPPGVKKPLNPILGETFAGYWDFPDGTRGYYIAEQTSHHPPKSSYFYMAPEHHIRIDGTLKPRSKFLGNSAASMMEGIAFLSFLNRGKGPKGERYIISQPNMYARGILFGKMKYELGDHSFVRCPELGLSADVEFKTKGYFGGTYNAIGGTIKNEKTGEVLYELSGMWTNEMWIKDMKTGKKDLLFDATRARHTPPTTRPIEEQDERESQKLWLNTAQAVKERNHVVATDEKTKIEDMQRDEAAKRAEEGVEWTPRLFRPVQGGPGGIDEGEEDLDWILNANIDGATPEKQVEQILAVTPILRGQKSNEKNPIPKRNPSIISTNTPSKAAPAPPAALPAPAPTGAGDLVDFGQNETPAQPQIAIPADLKAAQTENGGQQQKELESTLSQTSTSHAIGKGSEGLLDFHDMKATLPLQRGDTDSHSVDEYHDAKA